MAGLSINGIEYYAAAEVLKKLGISRQTLWRWRQQGKIPPGHRFRDGKTLFTAQEVETIREYATHIEPIDQPDRKQLGLFDGRKAV